MKKNIAVLITLLTINCMHADNTQTTTTRARLQKKTVHPTLQHDSDENEIADYEKHVCDVIVPQKESYAVATLKNIACTILIYYICSKEKFKTYYKKLIHYIQATNLYIYLTKNKG